MFLIFRNNLGLGNDPKEQSLILCLLLERAKMALFIELVPITTCELRPVVFITQLVVHAHVYGAAGRRYITRVALSTITSCFTWEASTVPTPPLFIGDNPAISLGRYVAADPDTKPFTASCSSCCGLALPQPTPCHIQSSYCGLTLTA